MSWMITRSGLEHHLCGYEVLMNAIDVSDIACSLAQTNRFTGHASRPYSVAEHSLLVADLASVAGHSVVVQLACLMHDAHEAYTGDQSSPAKRAIGLPWVAFERQQADHVRRSLGLITAFQSHHDVIHRFDMVALATERRDLTPWRPGRHRTWPLLDTPGIEISPADVDLNEPGRAARTWAEWRDMFLERYFALASAVHASEPQEIAP
jgi:uncharacterized protein